MSQTPDNEQSINTEDGTHDTVINEASPTNTSNGKAVFALKSMRYENGKEFQDGYLLFKSITGAISITQTCAKELAQAKDPNNTKRKFGSSFTSFYIPVGWVNVREFYSSNVNARGSFFTRDLAHCCEFVIQDETLNDNLDLSAFELPPENPTEKDLTV